MYVLPHSLYLWHEHNRHHWIWDLNEWRRNEKKKNCCLNDDYGRCICDCQFNIRDSHCMFCYVCLSFFFCELRRRHWIFTCSCHFVFSSIQFGIFLFNFLFFHFYVRFSLLTFEPISYMNCGKKWTCHKKCGGNQAYTVTRLAFIHKRQR